MSTSLTLQENIRSHIDLISENQDVTQEALGDVVKKAKSWWADREQKSGANRAQRSGAKELDYFTDQHAKWLGVLMGRQGVDYPELTFDHLRNYLAKNNINLNKQEIDPILQKVRQQYNLANTTDQDPLSANKVQSQQIARNVLRQGIMKASSKLGLGKSAQEKPSAAPTSSAPASATTAIPSTKNTTPAPSTAAAAKPATSATTTNTSPTLNNRNPAYLNYIKDGKIMGEPALVLNIEDRPVNIYKVAPSKVAPAGWAFIYPDRGWEYPKKGDYYDEWFNDQWAAQTMQESNVGSEKSHKDALLAARQAEQQGDKARQYEKLAEYHTELSKINKIKSADRIHHTTQAGIYRNAAHAVKSAQENLAKSST